MGEPERQTQARPGPRGRLHVERDEEGLVLGLDEHAVRLRVPRDHKAWLGFVMRRLMSKLTMVVLSSVVLTVFAFVNYMDTALGTQYTPSWIKRFAVGAADRVKVEHGKIHNYGPAVAHLPRGRALLVLKVTSEVDLSNRLDLACDMVRGRGHVEGTIRHKVDPDDVPGGIRAGRPFEVEIDFPEDLTPYGRCRVVAAR